MPQERQQALTDRMQLIAEQLSSGPAILGEDHTQPDARAVLADLIQAGAVRELFLELPSVPLADLCADSPQVSTGLHARTVSGYLRHHAGEELKNDPIWQEAASALSCAERPHKNAVPLVGLIQEAQSKGVNVFFHDNAEIGPIRRSPADELAFRNEASGREFLQRSTSDNRVGTAVLVGSDHLKSDECNGGTMQQACDVNSKRVHDLSEI